MSNIIPVITLWQPWASWVIMGAKPIESRTHIRFKGLVGNTIGIHAANTFDDSDAVIKNPYLSADKIIDSMHPPLGVVLGTVHVDDFKPLHKFHSPLALIDCEHTKRWGLFLSSQKEFAVPVKAEGQMGIWYFDLDTMKKVKKPSEKIPSFF